MNSNGREVTVSALFDFLSTLSYDPFEQDAFAVDPQGALARAGLSADDVCASDSHFEGGDVAGGDWAACQTCSDPGPDEYPDPEHRDAP